MKEIKMIVEHIREELDGAEEYAKTATKYRDSDRELADSYFKKANDELNHVNEFHAQVVRLIKAQKAAGKEVPPAMQAVWDWEHDKLGDKTIRIKSLLEMYKK